MRKLWAISLITAGCSGSSGAPSPAPAHDPAAPSTDCGTLRPNLYSYCIDGTPPHQTDERLETEAPLPAGQDGFSDSVRIKGCDLGITPGDSGVAIEADLAVTCAPAATPTSATLELTLDAHATRRCAPGPYGSGAGAKPYWVTRVVLPGDSTDRYRVSVAADVGSDLSHGCVVLVDGHAGLPLYSGSSQPIAASFAVAGTTLVTLDCTAGDGLAVTACQGFTEGQPAAPVDVTTHLRLVIGASRCDASGC